MPWPFDGGVMEGIFGSSFSANPQMRSPAGMTPPFNPYGGAYPGGQPQQQPQQAQAPKVGAISPEDMGYLGADFQYGQLPPLSEDDRLAGIIDQISIFAGTMGGQPEIVQQAQKNELFRQQRRQQAYQMDLYARIGAAKLAEEQAAEEQKTRMAMMDWLRQSAPNMSGPVDPELAAALSQGIMGDQDAYQQALAQLPNFDVAGVEGQKDYQKGLAQEAIAEQFAPQVQQRAGDMAAATKFGTTAGEAQGIEQFGDVMAGQKGRESYATKAGSEKADLDVYKANREAYKQRAIDLQPQMAGAGKTAYSDPFVDNYAAGRRAAVEGSGASWEKWAQENLDASSPEEWEAAKQEFMAKQAPTKLIAYAKQQASILIGAAKTNGAELTPLRVVTILQDLAADPPTLKKAADQMRDIAAKFGLDNIVALLEVSAPQQRPSAYPGQRPAFDRMMGR